MEQDLLSNLPEIFLHDILSRLPEEDAARTSVFSKAWAQTWSTFPILSFSDAKIGRSPHYPADSREIKGFLDSVARRLLRFRNQGLVIEQFKLKMSSCDLYHLSKDVDLYLKLAIESGVKVLELDRHHCECPQYYILPTGIFEAKSLTKLVLMGKIKVDLSFMHHSMKFFSLQVLKLVDVFLGDDQTFKNFISCCPLIEYIIILRSCKYRENKGCLQNLDLCGLPKLKGVYVHDIQEVYVDSMCLENLHCRVRERPLKRIGFSKCKNLKGLFLESLRSTIITNQWFLKLFANLPFLESLKLRDCIMSERIDISSVQLKVLNLLDCLRLKEVNIDAPNLLSCVYSNRRCVAESISFLRCSSQMKVNIRFETYNLDFHNFKEFIQNFKPKILLASVSLSIDVRQSMRVLNPDVLQISSPPPSIKDLVLFVVTRNEAIFFPIVYGLLSNCCPTTISISFGCSREFIEFFYEALKGKHVDNCFCSAGNTKCWWHDLKDVKVTSTMNTDENVDFKTLLDMFFSVTVSSESICFSLEFYCSWDLLRRAYLEV